MRKKIFVGVFSLLLFFTSHLGGKDLFVKFSLGITKAGRVDGAGESLINYYDVQHVESVESGTAGEISLEFIYQFHPKFGVSLGFGFVKRTPEGATTEFYPPEGSPIQEEFQLAPVFASEVYPIFLNGIYMQKFANKFQMNIFGGLGYFFGRFLCGRDENDIDLRFLKFHQRYWSWTYESSATSFGYQLGAGIDINVSKQMFLIFEGLYRNVEFEAFDPSVIPSGLWSGLPAVPLTEEEARQYGEDKTFFYAFRYEEDGIEGDIQYNVNKIDFSGFYFRIALKFKF